MAQTTAYFAGLAPPSFSLAAVLKVFAAEAASVAAAAVEPLAVFAIALGLGAGV